VFFVACLPAGRYNDLMKKKYILLFAGFLIALNIFFWKEVFALNQSRILKVDFLDVGQGDSVFIETPEGHQIIIDGGPSSVLLEKLAERMPFWDKTIDLVILTHPEKDHMTGILDVLQRYKVDYFLWTGIIKNNAENKKLAELLNNAKNTKPDFLASLFRASATKVIAVSADEKIKAGKVSIDILYPFENLEGQEPKNTNDTSVVSKLVFGNTKFIFTGDISSAAERKIVKSGKNILADILKVAHHGSKYSTSDLFLENAKPKIAVISVGKGNSYGHPTPEVLQKLEKSGIKTLRTDTDGDINMVSDGKNIYLK